MNIDLHRCLLKDEKMKILFIATADCKYGAAKTQIDMIMELKENYGVNPVVLTKKHNNLNDLCDRLQIENYSYWYRDIMSGSAYSNPVLNILKHIVKYMVYVWGGITQHFIEHCGISMDEIDMIHSNHIRIDIGVYLSKKYDIPHIWHIKELNCGHVRIIHYKPRCYQYINHGADAFIAVTKQVKEYWHKAGLDADKIHVIYEGIDAKKFLPKKAQNRDKLKMVCVGRIEKSKGQLEILKAIKRLPQEVKENITLDLFGDAYPDYLHHLKEFIKKEHMEESIHFGGYCENIHEKLLDYDIGILSSKGDAFGTVTAEYMAAGLLAIATYTELVEHNVTGLRYEYGDIEQLANHIAFAFYHREKAQKLALEGMKKIREKFTIQNHARHVYELYSRFC